MSRGNTLRHMLGWIRRNTRQRERERKRGRGGREGFERKDEEMKKLLLRRARQKDRHSEIKLHTESLETEKESRTGDGSTCVWTRRWKLQRAQNEGLK